jgi:hypothetical protein
VKTLVVILFDIPTPDDLVEVINHIDPPTIPYFDGHVRIVPDPIIVVAVTDFLDDKEV